MCKNKANCWFTTNEKNFNYYGTIDYTVNNDTCEYWTQNRFNDDYFINEGEHLTKKFI